VRHTSEKALSPFASWSPGRGLKPEIVHVRFNVTIDKTVNSAFLGSPNLDEWLSSRSIEQIVLAGVQTNMCVESTARMGADLGYSVVVALDATYTFDLKYQGRLFTADDISLATAAR
jgi:nicotinamidase-related amidase